MAELNSPLVIPAPTGLDTSTPAQELPLTSARQLTNLLIHFPGTAVSRGPIYQLGNPDCGTDTITTGIWTFDSKLLVGRFTTSGTALVFPHRAPFVKPTAANQLANPNTTMKHLDTLQAAPTVTDVAAAASGNNVIGGRGVRLGAYVYGYAFGVDTAGNPAVNEQGGYLYRRKFLRWDGTTTAPTVYNNAPEGGQDVAVHLNRVWVAGGRDVPGGAPGLIEFNALYYSDQDGPTADTTAMWKDDASGLVNKIIVGAADPNDYLTALAHQGDNLVIFKRRSTYLLTGYSSATFNVRRISSEYGCIDPASVVEHGDKVYFMSRYGPCVYDGSSVRPFGGPVTDLVNGFHFLKDSLASVPAATDCYRFVGCSLSPEYIALGYVTQNMSTGAMTGGATYLFCVTTGRWTEFQATGAAYTFVAWLGVTGTGVPFMFDSKRTLNLEHVARRGAAIPQTRDLVNSVNTPVVVRWKTPLVRLGPVNQTAQLHKVLLEYGFIDPAGVGGTQAFHVDVYGPLSTALSGATFDALSMPNPPGYLSSRTHVADLFVETDQVTLDVNLSASQYGATQPSIQGVTVEYQSTRQKRGN